MLYTGTVTNQINVQVRVRSGTATVGTDFFSYPESPFVVGPDYPSFTITNMIHADGIFEAPEQFTIEVTGALPSVPHGPPTTVTIHDSANAPRFIDQAPTSSGEFRLNFSTRYGYYFKIYVSSDLANWSLLDRIYSFGDTIEILDRAPAGTAVRFYRVQEDLPY